MDRPIREESWASFTALVAAAHAAGESVVVDADAEGPYSAEVSDA